MSEATSGVFSCFNSRMSLRHAGIRPSRWLAMTIRTVRSLPSQNRANAESSGQRAFTNQRKRSGNEGLNSHLRPIMGLSKFDEKARESMSTRLRIISEMQRIAAEQRVTLPPLVDDLSLHETGFDSLGFAILVARLEDDLGIDPFTISEDASFPLTLGDFIRAYENVPA
jgi:acyl carrier protein